MGATHNLLKSLESRSPLGFLLMATEGFRKVWILGFVIPILLGLITSGVGILIGPVLQVIQSPLDQIHNWESIFGLFIGSKIGLLTSSSGASGMDLLYSGPLLLLMLVTLKAGLSGVHWYLWEYLGELGSKNVRILLANSLISVESEYQLTPEGQQVQGQLSSALTQDIRQMREFMVHYYGGFPREFFQVVMLLVSLGLLSPKLTGIFLGVVFPLGFIIRYIGRRMRRRAKDLLHYQAELTEWLEQRLVGIETIKHYRSEKLESENFRRFNSELSRKFSKAIATKARTSPTIELFSTCAFVVVLMYSLGQIQKGLLSGPVFFSFFSTLGLLSQSASKLGKYYNSNKEGTAALSRIRELLLRLKTHVDEDASDPYVKRKELIKVSAEDQTVLCLNELTVSYPGSTEPALFKVSYRFKAGKIYCIRGVSGSGKSTLFKALLGLLKPQSKNPTVLLNDLSRLTPNSVRVDEMISWSREIKQHPYPVSFMPQRIVPFNTSLKDHVTYPWTNGDTSLVRECLERVGLKDLVDSMPEGVLTRIGSEGRQLSGGQLQRLLLARLWYHKSPLILVDEGTSALDPETERVVHDFLKELTRRGSCVILIAHRQTQIDFADEVLTMENGSLS